jgi:hypothetical protein
VETGAGGDVDEIRGLIDYVNVPRPIGILLSRGKATLHELDTVYGVEDMYDMLEVVTIDAYNERIANQHLNRQGG